MADFNLATGWVDIRVDTTSFARRLARARRGFTGAMRRMAHGARRVGRAVGAILGPFKLLGKLMAPLAAISGSIGLGASVKAFADFESTMARVKAVSQATGAQFKKLWGQARQLGRSTVYSASQAAQAMANFSVAGFKVNETIAAMRPTLNIAAAGQLDMATASDIVAKTMRGMGLDATETAHAVDVMAKAFTTSNTNLEMLGDAFRYVGPVGKAAGKSLEELAASIQIMSDAGIQGQQAGVAMRNILLRLQSQPGEVAKVLDAMNISIVDSFGNMKSMATIVDELSAAMADMSRVERTNVASALASTRASAAFLTLIDAGGDKLRRYQQRLAGAGGTARRIAKEQIDTLSGSFKLLWSAVTDAAISIGQAMAPALRKVAGAMSTMMPTIGTIADSFRDVADEIGNVLVARVQSLHAWLKKTAPLFRSVFQVAADTISDPMGMAKVGLKQFQATGLDFVANMVEGLNNFIVDLRSMFSAVLTTWASKTKDAVMLGGATIKAAILSAVEHMPGAKWTAASNRAQWARSQAVILEKQIEHKQKNQFGRNMKAAQAKYRQGGVSTFLGTWADTMRHRADAKRQEAADEQAAIRAARERDQDKVAVGDFARQTWRQISTAVKSQIQSAGGLRSVLAGAGTELGKVVLGPATMAGLQMGRDFLGRGGGKAPKESPAEKEQKEIAKGGGELVGITAYLADIQRKAMQKDQKAVEETAKATKKTAEESVKQTGFLETLSDTLAGGFTATFAGDTT